MICHQWLKKALYEEYVIQFIDMQKVITNIWKIITNIKNYILNCDVNYFYGSAISQKLPVNKFEWIEDTSSFNEDFIKSYDGENDEGYSL